MESDIMSEPITKGDVMRKLERFAIAVCTAAVSVTSWALFENYKTNQKIMVILEAVQRNDARQDQAIAEIRGQMVTWETLRRIELYLMSQAPENRGAMVGRALGMELESRREKLN
jgi:hypothetical protein